MKFSIGQYSSITSISIKTLRLYHEKGILIPTEIDEFTKYRYYNESNFETARIIKILKNFDFSLAEIKIILEECSDESDLLEQLKMKSEQIQSKIAQYKTTLNSLESIIKIEKENKMKTEQIFDVEEKIVDTVLIAGYRMQGKYQDIGEGFSKVGKIFGRYLNGKPIALYYDGEYKEDDADYEACFPIRKGTGTDDISVRELKGGKCYTIIHKGSYETLSQSYKHLFEYINEKGIKTKLPTREVYLKGPGMIFKGNPKNYLTEIQIFIEE
ncbi:MAG: MerR family transcriptional regulator [Bacteroidetes bacterium]|nr:MerR family transcriptional regulator [Bacteroidota bacterium]MBU1114278.1 MerR family transcriptional regulator [Bacteroidota bacterium]MBU1798015.1 MerR family transcriptional regulator [Bacteroidota bacterium]